MEGADAFIASIAFMPIYFLAYSIGMECVSLEGMGSDLL